METREHKDLLKKQFAVQARVYPKTVRFRHMESVVPIIELARPRPSDRLIDLACGWGMVGLAFAPLVASVVGVDLTPEMVDLARKVAAERGFKNLEYILGDAEDLKYGPGSFEIATCRFTFHHLGNPEKALREMKRVLVPDGRIVLYDYMASSDEKKAKRLNEIEVARDPSHVRTYTDKEFHRFFKTCGLEVKGRVVTLLKRHLSHWMSFVDGSEAAVKKVRKMMEDSMEGDKAGLGIREREGDLSFTHTCVAWLLRSK